MSPIDVLFDLGNADQEKLKLKAEPVATADEARDIIIELEQAFFLQDGCVGLSAPQIGINKAVAIIRIPDKGVAIDLINPQVVKAGETFTNPREGCMSFPGRVFDTPRFKDIYITNDAIWMSDEDHCPHPLPDPVREVKDGKIQKVAGGRLVKREAAYGIIHEVENLGGIVCVAIQHEIDHLNGVCLPWKPGAEEKVKDKSPALVTGKAAKIGRNAKCPCGSGKKYKKCCGK